MLDWVGWGGVGRVQKVRGGERERKEEGSERKEERWFHISCGATLAINIHF